MSPKYLFFAFVFLLPFSFFLPVAMAGKTLLAVFVLSLLALQIKESLKSKEVVLKGGLIRNSLVAFLLFSLFSLVFSKNITQSFFGKTEGLDCFFFLSAFILVFFFSLSAFEGREDMKKIFLSFLSGSAVSSILLFFLAPGSVETLALTISLSLAVSLYFLFFDKKKVVFGILSLLFFCSLLFIGFKLGWLAPALFAFFIFWKKVRGEGPGVDKRQVILSFLCFAVISSFLFLPGFIQPKFSFTSKISLENSLDIALKSSFHDAKSFFLGSGPNTFNYQYALYKDKTLNQAAIEQSASGFLTILTTLGALAFLSLVFVFFLFLKKGFSCFLNKDSETDNLVFLVVFSIFVLTIVHGLDLVLFFLLFALLGFWESFSEKENRISFKWLIAAGLVFALMSVGFFKFFIAENLAQKAIQDFNNKDIPAAIVKMDQAARTFNYSDYYIGLSQLYLLKASDIFNNNWSLDDDIEKQLEEKQKNLRDVASQAEAVAEFASEIDGQSYLVWQNLGLIYENTSFLIEDKTDKALEAYTKAEEFSPDNFLIYLARARVYERKGDEESALKEYESAFNIYPSYEGLEEKMEELRD
jgi:tetratricopeptide (TPR) repeat protein